LILFQFIFDPGGYVPKYSSDKQCKSKLKKASGSAAYD